jgi:hypothetical protein
LLVVSLNGVRMTCHDGCRTASSLMSIAGMELCHLKRGVPTSACQVNLMTLTRRTFERLHSVPLPAHLGSVLGVINPGIWAT